jgi:hypothetical protein
MPKSATFTLPFFSTMMLWGLMSRWDDALGMGVIQGTADLRGNSAGPPSRVRTPLLFMYCLRLMPSMSP